MTQRYLDFGGRDRDRVRGGDGARRADARRRVPEDGRAGDRGRLPQAGARHSWPHDDGRGRGWQARRGVRADERAHHECVDARYAGHRRSARHQVRRARRPGSASGRRRLRVRRACRARAPAGRRTPACSRPIVPRARRRAAARRRRIRTGPRAGDDVQGRRAAGRPADAAPGPAGGGAGDARCQHDGHGGAASAGGDDGPRAGEHAERVHAAASADPGARDAGGPAGQRRPPARCPS